VTDPRAFASPATVRRFYPSFLEIEFEPLAGYKTTAEYWIPDSHSLVARFRLRNLTSAPHGVRWRFFASLEAAGDYERLAEKVLSGVRILAGRVGRQAIAVFVTGGASVEITGLPALQVEADLGPGQERRWTLVHCLGADVASAFEGARKLAAEPLDAWRARIEHVNSDLVDIETGEIGWDAALAFSQVAALRSILGGARPFPKSAFVSARRIDRGYSPAGDGREYESEWASQDPWLARQLAHALLPTHARWCRDLVLELCRRRSEKAGPEPLPGWKAEPEIRRFPPVLATLALRVAEGIEDGDFLDQAIPCLEAWAADWLSPEADEDGDGWPEWGTAAHAGLGMTPAFAAWASWGVGLEPRWVEAPDLAAYLYAEVSSLEQWAGGSARAEVRARWESARRRLAAEVSAAWSPARGLVRMRDARSHASPKDELIVKGRGAFRNRPRRSPRQPVRLLVRVRSQDAVPTTLQVRIRGRGPARERLEAHLTHADFRWYAPWGLCATQGLYSTVERVEVEGVPPETTTEVRTADYAREDATGLLPLWSGDLLGDRATRLIEDALLDERRFWRPFGIPSCSAADPVYAPDDPRGAGVVALAWNAMLAEGLAAHGRAEVAADLLLRLLRACSSILASDRTFRESWSAETGKGRGERGHVAGLFPVETLLRVAGIQLLSPTLVRLHGPHVFPNPLEVHWRGLRVRREPDKTVVEFPHGGRSELPATGEHVVEELPSTDPTRR
jgi:hypothetical protein